MVQKTKKAQLAEESAKTRKAREKLRKRLKKLDARITPQALWEKSLEIHRWIARHAESRFPLKEKSFSLFNRNQQDAKLAQQLIKVAQQFKNYD